MKPNYKSLTLPMAANEMTRDLRLVLLIAVLLTGAPCTTAGDPSGKYSKLSGIIIPGFASTQLRAWSILDCPYTPLDYNPLDLVWLDTTKVLVIIPLLVFLLFLYLMQIYSYLE